MRLKHLCTSFSNALAQSEVQEEGLYPVYGASGLVGYVGQYAVEEPYLGIVKDGAGVGRVNCYPPYTSLLGTLAYIIPNEKANIGWLKYVLVSLDLGKDSGKTTIPHIYFSEYGNRTIPFVPLAQQERIAAFLDTECAQIDAVIEQTRASIEEYKKLKQSVITQAVTKGIRPGRRMVNSGVDWIGQIPAEWAVFRIANLYDERNERGTDDLPILTVSINTGISDHEIPDEEKDRVVVRSEDRTLYKRVCPGDLAYNMMRAWQGAFGAARVDGMVSPAYVVAKPKKPGILDSRYVEALLRTSSAIEEMHRYSRGITDFRLRLYWPEFKNIRVCVPSIKEQVEIADYIDEKAAEIDALIQKKQQFLVELESYKKALIFEYVTGKKEVI